LGQHGTVITYLLALYQGDSHIGLADAFCMLVRDTIDAVGNDNFGPLFGCPYTMSGAWNQSGSVLTTDD
jgi:hypothetical protein